MESLDRLEAEIEAEHAVRMGRIEMSYAAVWRQVSDLIGTVGHDVIAELEPDGGEAYVEFTDEPTRVIDHFTLTNLRRASGHGGPRVVGLADSFDYRVAA